MKQTPRKYITNTTRPLIDYQKYGGIYNPLLYPIIAIDMGVIIAVTIWHKIQSLKANRRDIHWMLNTILIEQKVQYKNPDRPNHDKERAKETIRETIRIADELNIQSQQIENARELIDNE